MVKIISRSSGHFDVHDAWFEPVSKGITHIVCKLAAFNQQGQMVLNSEQGRETIHHFKSDGMK
jgi:hypothetical protein